MSNFDKLYEKIQDGTATDEEKRLFKAEIDKARRISAILDEEIDSERINEDSKIAEADITTVRKARKTFNTKLMIKIIVISVCSLLLVAAIVCGIIFIPSVTSAKRNEVFDRDEVIEIAKDYLAEYIDGGIDGFYIHDIDKDLQINGHLTNAVYEYEIEFRNENRDEYEVTVNAKSGYAIMTDVDLHHK